MPVEYWKLERLPRGFQPKTLAAERHGILRGEQRATKLTRHSRQSSYVTCLASSGAALTFGQLRNIFPFLSGFEQMLSNASMCTAGRDNTSDVDILSFELQGLEANETYIFQFSVIWLRIKKGCEKRMSAMGFA